MILENIKPFKIKIKKKKAFDSKFSFFNVAL